MTNRHKLGVYLAPQHDPDKWRNYLRTIDPGWIRVLMPGDSPADLISQIYDLCPEAEISLRWWDLDDGGDANKRSKFVDPERSAGRDVLTMVERITEMERVATKNGLPFPMRSQIWLNTPNEPPTWEHELRPQIMRNALHMFERAKPHGLGTMCFEMAVGHPEEWPPVWTWAKPVLDRIASDPEFGVLALHEYGQPEGPHYTWTDEKGVERKDWGALMGRYAHLADYIPIVISETGIDGRLYSRHQPPDTGYQKFMNATAYADQMREYLLEVKREPRIISVLPFITDFHDNEWASFDTLPATEAFAQMLSGLDNESQAARPVVVDTRPPAPAVRPAPPLFSQIERVKFALFDAQVDIERAIAILDKLEKGEPNE